MLLRANGRATARWLDNVNTDFDYRNYNVNIIMDHDTNDTQGRPSGGGMHTRSMAGTGTRRTTRDKPATPRGSRGSRSPASVSKATPKDAETTGAPGSAEAKACTPEPVNVEGLGVPVRTRRPRTARASVAAPAAKEAGPDASGAVNELAMVEEVAMNAGDDEDKWVLLPGARRTEVVRARMYVFHS